MRSCSQTSWTSATWPHTWRTLRHLTSSGSTRDSSTTWQTDNFVDCMHIKLWQPFLNLVFMHILVLQNINSNSTLSRGNRTPGSLAALQPRLRLAVAQAKYCNSFQLTHMPRGNHAQSIAREQCNGDRRKTRHYYSTHNLASTVSLACKRQ